ncbi:hypothetical protein JY651_23815 [Pyxidicoccus parkwayensis]|jgi:hypothetical protein|uniref:DUF3618 domain-containing protein n=1 Tax=Pyxidicoccus parkwayensis TaxID=2813578 RepID=A0ABX7PBD3_9BACT|nr:hypothetical protein [Pyxidicoccus parkwaysis]QSQ27742.1 hypothetical protein JY651_23815 [Pyxidicoccus parkwaysis]
MTTYPGATGNNGTPQSQEGGSNAGFGQRVDQIGSEAQQLWTDARSAVTDLGDTLDLRGRVERNPYGMMALGLAAGYVLGGGLFTPLTARIIRLGVRLAALPLVKDELIGMAERAFEGYQVGREAVRGEGSQSNASVNATNAGTPRPPSY